MILPERAGHSAPRVRQFLPFSIGAAVNRKKKGEATMPAVLRLQHTSVPMPADGHEAARRFYGGALGMTEVKPPSSLMVDRLVWFRAGPDGHEVHVFVDEQMQAKSAEQHLCLQVDDIASVRAQLSDRGIAIEETTAIANRPRFFVKDPFGNKIELTQITGDYD
jgi:catechol 2,3-dioxygenase-like lactoylglutathione lyase family enzyme